MKTRRIVVIGRTDVGRRVCSLLSTSGLSVVHLHEPSDADVRTELGKEIDGVAVMLHDDIKALRYGLMVHHIRPDVRLFVAMFDRTARAQLRDAVPGCVVLSPAAISVPAMVAGAIHPDADAVRRASTPEVPEWVAIKQHGKEGATIEPYRTPESVKTRGLLGRLAGQFRPYDSGTRVLLGGVAGLIAIICADTLVGLGHAHFLRALYDATRTTATISAPALPDEPWLLVWATLAALAVMCFTAMFAAGIVNYLLSGRHAAIFGRRVAPRFGHVIVVGMGQVGLRLAQELQALGVAVIGIEQSPEARSSPSRAPRTSRCSSATVLRRPSWPPPEPTAPSPWSPPAARRDNIAVAVAALAANPQLRVVLRSGSDDAIEETRSLFRIGASVDVNGLTAAFVAASLDDKSPYTIIPTPDGDMAIDEAGKATEFWPPHPLRCSCA